MGWVALLFYLTVIPVSLFISLKKDNVLDKRINEEKGVERRGEDNRFLGTAHQALFRIRWDALLHGAFHFGSCRCFLEVRVNGKFLCHDGRTRA